MKELIIATSNSGKIREIKDILVDIPLEIKSLSDIGLDVDVEENGKTFEENAILKAKTIGEKTGLLTLADDSGLEVDALGGKPGVNSARYAEGTDLDRINKLLKELKDILKEKRAARFRCVIALYIPLSHPESRFDRDEGSLISSVQNDNVEKIVTFKGVSEGYITEKPVGSNGFGYDPVFYLPELGKTSAQLTLKEKNRVSHRSKALIKCRDFLTNYNSL
ncbi:hypothetical protein A3D03_01960 [Candidatus Gottesmanbacteria bacterium RIFCSPHIGHO2_02_FULL_40_13]|uniref:dITP/XTP pyrophosphatase n=1 Tax=Candidatus Gottesmanbacteria bacterium RIFCSPHIGHO2_02_FULL_40_13 TaxID=1798384 RepID=A0A1F6AC19_9BACT|nr:MAG: hypothetical protein A3D03_01960 [Candidatus Gottesmanbacteria bacterium RIFCSPHIGHO2_02_FULL_40_13]